MPPLGYRAGRSCTLRFGTRTCLGAMFSVRAPATRPRGFAIPPPGALTPCSKTLCRRIRFLPCLLFAGILRDRLPYVATSWNVGRGSGLLLYRGVGDAEAVVHSAHDIRQVGRVHIPLSAPIARISFCFCSCREKEGPLAHRHGSFSHSQCNAGFC
jgi:hypothetical protein